MSANNNPWDDGTRITSSEIRLLDETLSRLHEIIVDDACKVAAGGLVDDCEMNNAISRHIVDADKEQEV